MLVLWCSVKFSITTEYQTEIENRNIEGGSRIQRKDDIYVSREEVRLLYQKTHITLTTIFLGFSFSVLFSSAGFYNVEDEQFYIQQRKKTTHCDITLGQIHE